MFAENKIDGFDASVCELSHDFGEWQQLQLEIIWIRYSYLQNFISTYYIDTSRT